MRRVGTIAGGWIVAVGGASLVTLLVVGFILGGYVDAWGAGIPVVHQLGRLPGPIRLAVEILVGVPVAFGVALYFITAWFELLWHLSWPVRKLMSDIRGSRPRPFRQHR